MTTLPFTLNIDPAPAQFFFTVRGTPAAKDHEGVRAAHNQVAGSDEGVAMARSFGDLSHAVYYPADHTAGAPKEMLFIDYWNSPQGLMQFFSNEQVQQGGKMVFSDRDYVLWANTPGLPRVSLPAPAGRNDRFVGLVRGTVASRAGAERHISGNDAAAWGRRKDQCVVAEKIRQAGAGSAGTGILVVAWARGEITGGLRRFDRGTQSNTCADRA